jgi:S-methylmethionine-dependent homocysteine/selenocysteine methylase
MREMIMSQYRKRLPQLDGGLFLSDGGIETTLIFHEGLELPHFAAFHLLKDAAGTAALRRYFVRYAQIARANETGFILESPTWRASPDWGEKLGYSTGALASANAKSIELMQELRWEFQSVRTPVVVSGCVGPRGDGYDPGTVMSSDEAQDYHVEQIRVLAETQADMIAAITMTNASEAIGITHAAQAARMPVAISFTLETDGRLPTGQSLAEAIAEVDEATGRALAYYMINCAHPTHFYAALAGKGGWLDRIRGIRANASKRSHAELNEAPDLDAGDPVELGEEYRAMVSRLPHINVLGGCCGTDHRHIAQICSACRNVEVD